MTSSNSVISNKDIITGFIKVILIDHIFQQIQEFLDDSDTVNSILNVSGKFQDSKKSNFYWKLNRKYSLEFHRNVSYKFRLDTLLTDVKKQLSLTFGSNNKISDVSALGNVHALDLRSCYGISDVSTLGNVHTLDISWCSEIKNVSA